MTSSTMAPRPASASALTVDICHRRLTIRWDGQGWYVGHSSGGGWRVANLPAAFALDPKPAPHDPDPVRTPYRRRVKRRAAQAPGPSTLPSPSASTT